MALLMPIVTKEVSIDWLTVTLKYDNHGGGQSNAAHPRIIDEVRDRLMVKSIEHKLDLTRPDEINGEKHE